MTSTKRLYLAPDAPYPYELVSLLSRTPMTPAEALWLNDLLARLRPQPKQDTNP